MINNIQNKVVVITGASAGVGKACAETFARLGARLVLVARGQEALQALADELASITDVLSLPMDIGSENNCAVLIDKTIEHFGALHVLINNAGLHHRGNLETRTPQDIAAMVNINLRVPLQLTTTALPYIRNAGGGAVIMVGSLAGRAPLAGAATYAATKAGLRAFTHSLADELQGSDIHIGIVSPGPIDTGFIMDEIDNVEDIVYSQPMSSAQQVADAIVQLTAGKATEIPMPWVSGKLTTLSYLFPRLRRAMRPLLYKIGAGNKNKYRRRGTDLHR